MKIQKIAMPMRARRTDEERRALRGGDPCVHHPLFYEGVTLSNKLLEAWVDSKPESTNPGSKLWMEAVDWLDRAQKLLYSSIDELNLTVPGEVYPTETLWFFDIIEFLELYNELVWNFRGVQGPSQIMHHVLRGVRKMRHQFPWTCLTEFGKYDQMIKDWCDMNDEFSNQELSMVMLEPDYYPDIHEIEYHFLRSHVGYSLRNIHADIFELVNRVPSDAPDYRKRVYGTITYPLLR